MCIRDRDYAKRLAQTNEFVSSADDFFADTTAIGANVTMPFKHDAMNWVDELSEQAQRAGAVNTIIRRGQKFVGDNTDGIGLVSDLKAHGLALKAMNVLLIGAGGAAKGAIPALIEAGVSQISIYNRSVDKAEHLAAYTCQYAPRIARVYETPHSNFDLIINATSLSLQHAIPQLPDTVYKNKPAIYDMVYLSQPTAFMQKAKTMQCDTLIDGLGMLVHQAAQSFYLWFDVRPDTLPVYKFLREHA